MDDKITCLETKLLDFASVMTRSSSLSTKRKVDSPPPSDRSTTRVSVSGHIAGAFPPAKQAKDDDNLPPPMPPDYDIDQWPLSLSEEGPPLSSLKQGRGKLGIALPPMWMTQVILPPLFYPRRWPSPDQ